jgi:hypothetical protein
MPVLVISALRKAPPTPITMIDLLSRASIVAMVITEVVDAVGKDKLSNRSLYPDDHLPPQA